MLPPDWGRWHPSQPVAVYADTFVYFWVFWGVLVVLFLILHIIRLISDCLDRCEPLPEPAESIYKPDHSADFKTCSICLEDFVENDKLHWLPCSHVFHADCVDEWIRMHHLQCPVCLTGCVVGGESLTRCMRKSSPSRMAYPAEG